MTMWRCYQPHYLVKVHSSSHNGGRLHGYANAKHSMLECPHVLFFKMIKVTMTPLKHPVLLILSCTSYKYYNALELIECWIWMHNSIGRVSLYIYVGRFQLSCMLRHRSLHLRLLQEYLSLLPKLWQLPGLFRLIVLHITVWLVTLNSKTGMITVYL